MNGEITRTSLESDRSTTVGTIQCCHCGTHWEAKPGSGKLRGFCGQCNALFCGPKCETCIHWRQKLDNLKGGLEVNHRPVIVQGLDIGALATR